MNTTQPEESTRKGIDDAMSPEEFAAWLGVGADWVRRRLTTLPGVVTESRKVIRIIPRYYVEARLKKGKA